MSEPGFVVGGRYANAAGDYDVLAIENDRVRIRYVRGLEMTLPARGLWSQWEALIAVQNGSSGAAPHVERPPAPARPGTARATGAVRSSRAPAAAPGARLPRKGASGDSAFFATAGYVAAGCEIRASVAGRDYMAFAQRYEIHTGKPLDTHHPGLEVHERPTHHMRADLSLRFPADSATLAYLSFGREVAIERTDAPGIYAVTKQDVIERLFRLGFELGTNSNPGAVRAQVPEQHRDDFDRGVALRTRFRR